MPVRKHGRKWRIGSGTADYDTKADAERAYQAYLAKRHGKKRKR